VIDGLLLYRCLLSQRDKVKSIVIASQNISLETKKNHFNSVSTLPVAGGCGTYVGCGAYCEAERL
jgi:hypothetical protein